MGGEARPVHENHRVRRAAVDEPHGHAAVRRVVDGPLALHQDPIAAGLPLLHEPLAGALDEVTDHAVHGHAPALDHHAGLAGGHEAGGPAGGGGGAPELQRHGHLADGAVRAHREDHALAGEMAAAHRRDHALRRPAVVDDPDARGPSGLRELLVVAQERVQAGQDVQAGPDGRQDHRAPRLREAPARGRDADEQRRGPRDEPQGLVERTDDRDVEATRVAQPLADVAAGLGGVDHRHHLVGAEPDHSHCGLAVVEAEVALGEDHEAAIGGCGHLDILCGWADGGAPESRSSRETKTPPADRRRWLVLVLVPHTGFEPVISALRGRRPGPLDECGRRASLGDGCEGYQDPTEPRNRAGGRAGGPRGGGSRGRSAASPPPGGSSARPARGRSGSVRRRARTGRPATLRGAPRQAPGCTCPGRRR